MDDASVEVDTEKLLRFVSLYCRARHPRARREPFVYRYPRTGLSLGPSDPLCGSCTVLLRHALTMRVLCPLDPKPRCRNCPQNCYRPRFRQEMERVMRHSGPRLLLERLRGPGR